MARIHRHERIDHSGPRCLCAPHRANRAAALGGERSRAVRSAQRGSRGDAPFRSAADPRRERPSCEPARRSFPEARFRFLGAGNPWHDAICRLCRAHARFVHRRIHAGSGDRLEIGAAHVGTWIRHRSGPRCGSPLDLAEIVAYTVPDNARSRAVMDRIGMAHDPAGDFDHPAVPAAHPLWRHVLYRLKAPAVAV